MPEDILAKTAPRASAGHKKFSAIGVILAIILALVLILFGERLIFDLNRWINPKIQQQYDYGDNNSIQYPSVGMNTLSRESNVLAPDVPIYYSTREKAAYLTYKLLIHAAFIIPVFLLVFLLY